MNLAHNTILLTGGASGIGLALAERLQVADSQVIAVSRRADKLDEARQRVPGLLTYQADLAQPAERIVLAEWVKREHPQLNVLFNNAGISNQVVIADLSTSPEAWEQERQELAINFDAPVHLSVLLLPHLQGKPGATILNVSSGLAFVPLAVAPLYSATKAALHSFTRSLRYQAAARLGATWRAASLAAGTAAIVSGIKHLAQARKTFAVDVGGRSRIECLCMVAVATMRLATRATRTGRPGLSGQE